MVKRGDCLINPILGKKVIFLKTSMDTNGEYIRYEMYEEPKGMTDMVHLHPIATEKFTVLSGTLTTLINGVEKDYHAGEYVVIPPGTMHNGWNGGEEVLHLIGEISPAMRYEDMYAINYGLVSDGKCDENGNPALLQVAVTMNKLKNHTYYEGSRLRQRVLLQVLSIIGRMKGYKAFYEKYNGKDE